MANNRSFYSGGEPPTPTKTPTSPNFFLNSFQTPKQDSRSHGALSPWTPNFPSAASPDFKTPTRLNSTTPTKSPTQTWRATSEKDLQPELSSHVDQLSSQETLPLPPVDPAQRLPSSPNTAAPIGEQDRHKDISDFSHEDKENEENLEVNTSIKSASSMQTPPPTSTSASRRKIQQAQVARLVKESAKRGGLKGSLPALAAKPSAMEVSGTSVEESPQQIIPLQFSPDGFTFPMSNGPATAPVYPQHKLFWDPDQSGEASMNIDFPMDDIFTSFGAGIQKNLDPFVSSHDQSNVFQFPVSPAFNHQSQSDNIAAFPTSHVDDSPSHTATSAVMTRNASRGHGVNPSLLFSSPSRVVSQTSSMLPAGQTIQDDNLRPYAHQIRDAQLEMELDMHNRKLKRKRATEGGDSPAVKVAVQTLREDHDDPSGIQRDVLDIAEAANNRSKSSNSNSSRGKQFAGHASLQRRQSRHEIHRPASVPLSHKRTSVTLTIDANGRAKTETKVLGNEARPSSRMHVDSDEDSKSSSSSNAEIAMSQPQSFAYPSSKPRNPPLGRFSNGSNSHSQNSSCSSTLGSSSANHNLLEATNRRGSNLFMQSNAYDLHPTYAMPSTDQDESEAETIIDSDSEKGDAQSELKKLRRSRSQKKGPKRATFPAHTKVLPDQQRPYPSHGNAAAPYYTTDNLTPTHLAYNDPFNNISPTTITDPNLTTPGTNASTISSDSIRCLCHTLNDDGQLMVQW